MGAAGIVKNRREYKNKFVGFLPKKMASDLFSRKYSFKKTEPIYRFFSLFLAYCYFVKKIFLGFRSISFCIIRSHTCCGTDKLFNKRTSCIMNWQQTYKYNNLF